ncbi:hypothetical protein ACQP1G_16470 [Nocardia sp. CA-107356]|uniref:hypothetical protein n=1 Tax=Nocardia sp. CA-107356 TaxID=3239972 RepID=UPI003D927118
MTIYDCGMPRDPLVHFPAYRHHERARQQANDGMMALLVGAKISAQFLGLSRGSSKLISEIFPAIQHVERLKLKPDDSQRILAQPEELLGAMAVPYTLAIHEAFILDCLKLAGVPKTPKAWVMHATLAGHAGGTFNPGSITQYHVLREMRNAVIHRGGLVDHRLVDVIADLIQGAESNWKKHAGRSPRGISSGDTVTLTLGELVMALATTKVLAREANQMLATTLSTTQWAEIIVDDFLEQSTGKLLNPSQRRRGILGHRQFYYSATAVSDAELEAVAAARRAPIT